MINFLRKKVSGKKNRFNTEGFDLDLTYITPRVIAMSLPGEGVHKVYRNSIDSVAKFIKQKHDKHCKVINVSGVRYDYEKFYNNVNEYQWADHYPPPIDLLFEVCQEIHSWLCSDIENVVAINCKAGKGRTGTLICCYLIYCGRITTAEEALSYYKFKRFSKGGGVTQPSQIRYIYYFCEIYHKRVKSPLILSLLSLKSKTIPHMSGNGSKIIFEIEQNDNQIYSNKQQSREAQEFFEDNWEEQNIIELEKFPENFLIQGDIQCYLNSWGIIKVQKICRFTFNTAFIEGDEWRGKRSELDPDKFVKEKSARDEFEVILSFKRLCGCSSDLEFNERCVFCKVNLDHGEVDKWFRIKEILKNRVRMNSKILLFFNPEYDDIDDVLVNK